MRGSRSMRRKIEKKKSNKRVTILAFLFVVTILASVVTIPKFTSRASENSNNTNERIINILEIEPSAEEGLFKLYNATLGSTKVKVTKMDMSRFISMVDEINGKYDIVYIGNNYGGLCKYWTASSRYRQYCNKTNLQWGDLWDRSNYIDESEYSQFLWYGCGGYVPKNDDDWEWVKKFKSALIDQGEHLEGSLDGKNYKPFVEYYSENDITNKRANEIIKLLNSNQLVYMDSSIDNLNDTKLQKLYREYNSKIQVVSNSDNLLNKIVSDYDNKSEKDKRPIVNFISKPQNDSTTLRFKFNFKGAKGVDYKAKLYIDKDGDGLFTGSKDSNVTLKGNISNDKVNSLSYSLGSKFIGYYGWKLEIYNTEKNDIKCYDTGNIVINNKNGNEKDIKILQIKPDSGCTFDMASNDRFKQLLEGINNYNVTVNSITITNFNNNINNGTNYDDYSMIVLGFGDSYGGIGNQQFNDKAIDYLLDWNNKGKSLMLTHDTIGLGLLKDVKASNDGKAWDIEYGSYCSYKLGRAFKDIVGQCRFEEDPFKNYSGVTYDDSYYEKFDDKRSDSEKYATLGITAYANVKLYEKTKATEVELVNENQISNYPYKLSNEDKINISQTHCQWYQLNLEEEDIVPSYNLVDVGNNKFMDSGDSRNFCYTYTKGNITYTGSGHKEITQDSEMKLFINTMIKAYMAGNEAPEILNYDKETNAEIKNGETITLDISTLQKGKGFDFYSIVKDDSSEDADINVTIAKNSNYLYNNVCKYNGSLDGIKIDNLSISYNDLVNNLGNTIKVTSKAKDAEGASSEDAVFYIKVICNKVKIINGINKDDEKVMAENPNIYSKYQRDWYVANSDESHGVKGDSCYTDTNIALEGTRGYQYVVPFISKINTNVFNNAKIILTLDENHSSDKDNKFGKAYYDNNQNSICTKPTLYLDCNNKLYKVKELERNETTGKYEASICFDDLASAYYEASVNASFGDECNLVLKYYGKTYNHNKAGEPSLKYTNSVEFGIVNGKSSISTTNVYVGNKELSGNLF